MVDVCLEGHQFDLTGSAHCKVCVLSLLCHAPPLPLSPSCTGHSSPSPALGSQVALQVWVPSCLCLVPFPRLPIIYMYIYIYIVIYNNNYYISNIIVITILVINNNNNSSSKYVFSTSRPLAPWMPRIHHQSQKM